MVTTKLKKTQCRTKKKLEPILINTQVLTPEIAVTYSDHARAMIETEELDKRKDFPKRYRGVIEMWHAKLMNLAITAKYALKMPNSTV